MFKRRGEITAIKDLFAKYKTTLQAPQKTVELETIRVVGEILHITLKEEQVSYTVSSRILRIKAPSIIRQEVQLKSPAVLAELKKRLGVKSSPTTIL